MSASYEACGGCGAQTPAERCIGCLHDFGDGPLFPSQTPEAAGLEVVDARWKRIGDGHSVLEQLVTAASAQARIDAAEARNAEVSMLAYRWMEAHDRLKAGLDYDLPTPADLPNEKARADRLAKTGDRLVDALHRYGFPVSGGARVALTDRGSAEAVELDEAASNFRAALQQETQP